MIVKISWANNFSFNSFSAEAYKQGMAEGQELRLGIKSERRENEQKMAKKTGEKRK